MAFDPEERRRARIPGDDVATLMNALTVDQLRTALSIIKPGAKPGGNDRQSVIDAIQGAGSNQKKIRATLLQVEAFSPSSHCIFLPLPTDVKLDPILNALKAYKDGLIKFQAHTQVDTIAYLTFEIDVPAAEWVEHPPGNWKAIPFKIRHPFVLRVDLAACSAIVTFPGFSQGEMPRAKRIEYPPLIAALFATLGDCGFTWLPFPVQQAIQNLGDHSSDRFMVVKTKPALLGGAMVLESHVNSSVEEVFMRSLASELTPSEQVIFKKALTAFIKKSKTDQVMLIWTQEKLLSTITYWSDCTHFHFTWRETHRTYRIVHDIFELLRSAVNVLGDDTTKPMWEFIATSPAHTIFKPSDLHARYGSSAPDIKAVVQAALTAGLILPVYRIANERVMDPQARAWTPELVSLRRKYETDDGEEVDGSDPKEIAIGFERTQAKDTPVQVLSGNA